MANQRRDHETIPYSNVRRALRIMLGSAHRQRHAVHGLFEADVTIPRALLRQHRAATGEALSFTGYLVTCLSRAVDENRRIHAYAQGRRLILFEDVDVATLVERQVAGEPVGTPYIIRAANRKTLREIHQEIRQAQTETAGEFEALNRFAFLPTFLLVFIWRIFWWLLRTNPQVQKKYGGTVGLSAVGMFVNTGGWGIPIPGHTLDVTVGGISAKPVAIAGNVTIRDYLDLTVSVNHDILDGAPIARFVRRFTELIESGFGLEDLEASPEAGETPPANSY